MKRTLAISASILLLPASWALSADSAKPWKFNSELSIVSANGNSKSTTFSNKNKINYDWSKVGLEVEGGALSSESEGKTTAEQFYGGEKANWKFSGKNYLFERYRWDRDRFAGILHRHDASLGLGRELLSLPKDTLNLELGAGYVNEDRKNSPRNEFGAGRAYGKYVRKLSDTANFSQDGEYILNFKDEEDYRANTESALTASITTHFSVKVSFQWKRVNKPPVGFIKDDTYTSAALIVNY